ncbi:MAG: hypothetical protein ACTS5Y_05595 [Pollutimonas bauzanensis]|uniref:Uncharacterized protein n=1 Tax=Pollutimonas bauzanensis TaxID=658167 RepID=A0A1M5NKX9_9BURK|nr:hypothetical protein [Pollutimonas bauzanensis]SHG90095.1 hypothetical protein SAMN04488135_101555 [Pollutimonas bauzanensis]
MNPEQIVTGVGIYTTRGGKLAFVTELAPPLESAEINCVGYVLIHDQRAVASEWHRWSLDGRCRTGDDQEYHLIERV